MKQFVHSKKNFTIIYPSMSIMIITKNGLTMLWFYWVLLLKRPVFVNYDNAGQCVLPVNIGPIAALTLKAAALTCQINRRIMKSGSCRVEALRNSGNHWLQLRITGRGCKVDTMSACRRLQWQVWQSISFHMISCGLISDTIGKPGYGAWCSPYLRRLTIVRCVPSNLL